MDYYILQCGKLSNFLYIGGDLPKLASFVILLLDGDALHFMVEDVFITKKALILGLEGYLNTVQLLL